MDVPRKRSRRSHVPAPRTSSEIDTLEQVGQDSTQQFSAPGQAPRRQASLSRTDKANEEAVLRDHVTRSLDSPTSSTPSQPNSQFAVPTDDIVLWYPEYANGGTWLSLPKVPTTLRNSLERKLEEDYTSVRSRMIKFSRFLRESNPDLSLPRCANKAIFFRPSKSPLCEYERAAGNSKRSCDSCIENHRLCLRHVHVGGKTKLALFPLSGHQRFAKVWTDFQYWVRE